MAIRIHDCAASSQLTAQIPRLVACLLAISLAACSAAPTPTPAPTGILGGSVQTTTFDQVKQAVGELYSHHPGINSFVVRGVTYNLETRDKVLEVCREGGLAGDDAQRETQRILACAPLILFFYSYGEESGVPESVDVARSLYWFALSNNSEASGEVLTDLLASWEIE